MGIIRRGILGGFTNKVGNIVGSTWKGIAIIKSLPLSVANPRTAAQVRQRNKFKELVHWGSILLSPIIKPLWDRWATQMSGFNAFISANQGAFSPSGQLELQKLQLSRGRILEPALVRYAVTGQNLSITLTHPQNDRFGLPTDRIFIVALDEGHRAAGAAVITNSTRGSQPTTQLSVPYNPTMDPTGDVYVYAGYLRADGSEVSNSKWAD